LSQHLSHDGFFFFKIETHRPFLQSSQNKAHN
jgi:hypothetical protein